MHKVLLHLFFVATLTFQLPLDAVFKNTGTLRSRDSIFRFDIFNNMGIVEGLDSVDLTCDKLIGNGLIKGIRIKIIAIACEYTGVIECNGECILITDTPESELKFEFRGGNLIVKKYSGHIES